MPINPLLSLQVQSTDFSGLGEGIASGLKERRLRKDREAEIKREEERFATQIARQDARFAVEDERADRSFRLDQQRLALAERGLQNEEQLKKIQMANATLDQKIKKGEIAESEINSLIKGSAELNPFLKEGNIAGGIEYLQSRLESGNRLGLDMKDTEQALQILESGDPEQLKQLSSNAEALRQIGIERGLIKPVGGDTTAFQKDVAFLESKGIPTEEALKAARGGTTVNVGTGSGGTESFPGEAGFREERLKAAAKTFDEFAQESKSLSAINRSYGSALRILEGNPNIQTGVGSRNFNKLKTVAVQAGLVDEDTAKTVSDFSALESRVQDNTLEKTQVLKGAITEREGDRAEQAAGSLSASRAGFEKQMRLAQKLNEIQISYNDNAEKYFTDPNLGNGSMRGYEDYFENLEDRPKLDDDFFESLNKVDEKSNEFEGFEIIGVQ